MTLPRAAARGTGQLTAPSTALCDVGAARQHIRVPAVRQVFHPRPVFHPGDAVHRIPASMAKERKQRNDWVDRLLYVALRLVAAALHCFPVNTNLRTAKLIGSLMYRFDRRHRDRAWGTCGVASRT